MKAKYSSIVIATLLFCFAVKAQQQAIAGVSMRGSYGNEISILDVNGRPFEAKYADVAGHPFFDQSFKYATIQLANGKNFEKIKARIDLCTNEISFLTSDNKEFYIPFGIAKSIFYIDSLQINYPACAFKLGFPAIGNLTGNSFYQVLSEGKCTLLKSISKSVITRKNDMSGEISKEFETYESYYVFSKGEMKKLKKDKDFILAELFDKQARVEQFLQANKINIKNMDGLVKVFDYYNSLQ